MKADEFGTPSEQKRYRAGWTPGRERPEAERRWDKCEICAWKQYGGSHCSHILMSCATQSTSICRYYRSKSPV